MDNLGKIAIIFSLLGVFLLYSLSVFVIPPFVPLDEVALHEGTTIRTRGVITDFSITESGNVLMKIEGNQTELPLFITSTSWAKNEELSNLSYGDEIAVEGRVEIYRGKYELFVSKNGIKKVTPRSTVSFVSQIAVHPEEYEGSKLRVVGYADDVYHHVLYLRDETGTYRLRAKLLATDTPIPELQEDDKIIAEGVFSYDAQNMRYELNLIALRHCD